MLPRFVAFCLLSANIVVCHQPAVGQVGSDLAASRCAAPQDDSWRRTCHGWQHNTYWPQSSHGAIQEPNLCHPLVVVALVLLLSVGGLIAFPADSNSHKSR